MKYCTRDGLRYPDDASRCTACGSALVHASDLKEFNTDSSVSFHTASCPNPRCQTLVAPPQANFCATCGQKLEPISFDLWTRKCVIPSLEADPVGVFLDPSALLRPIAEMGLPQGEAKKQLDQALAERAGLSRSDVERWMADAKILIEKAGGDVQAARRQAMRSAKERNIPSFHSSKLFEVIVREVAAEREADPLHIDQDVVAAPSDVVAGPLEFDGAPADPPAAERPPTSARRRISRAYRNWLDGRAARPGPNYVERAVPSSLSGSGEGAVYLARKGSGQTAFVLFTEDEQSGWVFPNPRRAYKTEDLSSLFPALTEEVFNSATEQIEPVPAKKVADGLWRVSHVTKAANVSAKVAAPEGGSAGQQVAASTPPAAGSPDEQGSPSSTEEVSAGLLAAFHRVSLEKWLVLTLFAVIGVAILTAWARVRSLQGQSDVNASRGGVPREPTADGQSANGRAAGGTTAPSASSENLNANTQAEGNGVATVSIYSYVGGVTLTVDGRSVAVLSQNQTRSIDLPAGRHMLRAVKTGYPAWERAINLGAGERAALQVSFDAAQAATPQDSQGQAPQPSPTASPAPSRQDLAWDNYRAAQQLYLQRQYDEAASKAGEGLSLDPENQSLRQLSAEIERAKQSVVRPRSAAPPPTPDESTPKTAASYPQESKAEAGGQYEPPHMTRRAQPSYPPLAYAARAEGTVIVDVTVDEQGNVTSAKANGGPPLLRQAAEEAARRSKFNPARRNGQPIASSSVINYTFRLYSQ